jgi:hypothetical protein
LWISKMSIPMVRMLYSLRPKLLECFDRNKILRNLRRICKNAQLGFNPDLNQLFNELFCIQNRVVNKKI